MSTNEIKLNTNNIQKEEKHYSFCDYKVGPFDPHYKEEIGKKVHLLHIGCDMPYKKNILMTEWFHTRHFTSYKKSQNKYFNEGLT